MLNRAIVNYERILKLHGSSELQFAGKDMKEEILRLEKVIEDLTIKNKILLRTLKSERVKRW